MDSLPKTVTRQRRDCDLNQGSSVPESSTLTTRQPSHPSGCDYRIGVLAENRNVSRAYSSEPTVMPFIC